MDMKRRDGGEDDGRKASGGAQFVKKKKRRLGGKGLSLEAFVGANKSKPVVTASQIHKQREEYQNAKKVQKYRKTLKHLAEEGHDFKPCLPLPQFDAETSTSQHMRVSGGEGKLLPTASISEWTPAQETEQDCPKENQLGGRGKKFGKRRAPTHLEKLREEYEKKKQAEEAEWKERREALVKTQAAREKSKHERKEVQNKMRKKTQRGQPVMKHRMEHLLDMIQHQLTE